MGMLLCLKFGKKLRVKNKNTTTTAQMLSAVLCRAMNSNPSTWKPRQEAYCMYFALQSTAASAGKTQKLNKIIAQVHWQVRPDYSSKGEKVVEITVLVRCGSKKTNEGKV